ncbi:MAG: type 2 isopentenyl-diphosphate Delta-isomerase [Chloroflexota bacterium]|nr:type 2 isopentenyl-diphosphate Delta-isomerase [Chloroflexota bacterium]
MTNNQSNQARKEEHLQINLAEDIQFKEVTTGLEKYYFLHQALPEIDAADVDLSTTLYGKRLKAPLIISSMTGGVAAARRINRNLARAAQATGIAMALGSLRAAIEDPGVARTYQIRDVAPDILLFANLGAVQLNYGFGVAECLKAVEITQADALILHLNPLQEALQPEGNTNFAGLVAKIEQVCRQLPVPVIAKEVGLGISAAAAQKLIDAGVAGIDVAGAGGTSWSEGERRRARSQTHDRVAAAFSGWGIPTAESIRMVRQSSPGITLIASGGIRSGIDAAKAICLGADAIGIAAPFLKAAAVSPRAVTQAITEITEQLRIAMFCIGAANLEQLKHSPFLQRRQ